MNNNKKQAGAWKQFGALVMAGVLTIGTGVSVWGSPIAASAEESGVVLNVAADEEETEAVETEESEKEPETFAEIDKVNTGDGLVTAIDVSEVVNECIPSIVSITNTETGEYQSYYGIEEYTANYAASGIIIAQTDTELLIATNSHVILDKEENYVWFTVDAEDPDTVKVPARVKGMDRSIELAIVAVELKDIPSEVRSQIKIAELGSSSNLKIGQTAIAIGNELGLGVSVTCGIISALDREVVIDDYVGNLIMMDTTINFGSSGGAVLNSKGQVVGICVAKEAGNGSEGMSYAIPIDEAIPVLQKLAERQTRDKLTNSERGYMGATVVNVTDDAKDLYAMPVGAFVYEVAPGSGAEAAGIKKGDVITKFDGEDVTGSDDLIEKMSFYEVGETVTVEVMTANNGEYESREVEVTLQAGAADPEESEEGDEKDSLKEPQEGNGYEMSPFGYGNNGNYMIPFGYGFGSLF